VSLGSVDIYLDAEPEVSLNDGTGEPFAVIDLTPHPGRAYIAIRTRAEADWLVRAALAARDLLPEPDLDMVVSRACRDGDHMACVNDNDSPQCGYPCECGCHPAPLTLPPDIVPGDLDAIPANRIGGPAVSAS
jgi:hypothetical protein